MLGGLRRIARVVTRGSGLRALASAATTRVTNPPNKSLILVETMGRGSPSATPSIQLVCVLDLFLSQRPADLVG